MAAASDNHGTAVPGDPKPTAPDSASEGSSQPASDNPLAAFAARGLAAQDAVDRILDEDAGHGYYRQPPPKPDPASNGVNPSAEEERHGGEHTAPAAGDRRSGRGKSEPTSEGERADGGRPKQALGARAQDLATGTDAALDALEALEKGIDHEHDQAKLSRRTLAKAVLSTVADHIGELDRIDSLVCKLTELVLLQQDLATRGRTRLRRKLVSERVDQVLRELKVLAG